MLEKLLKTIVALLMLAGLAGSAYFWNETQKRDTEIAALNDDIDAVKKRMRATQKKYTQEKAKLGTCLRMKMAEESKRIKFQKLAEAMVVENQALAARKEAAENKYKNAAAVYAQKLEALNAYKEKLTKRYDTLVEKYKALALADREKTGEIRMLEGDKKGLESEMAALEKRLERNRKHNERLCVITEELTEKYREKTKNSADPFTKLGMIEIEHMLQEYIKRIDKEKLVAQ
ncbi:MAG: hypothetical protein HUN04_25710 [Desulfobacter sp.]|nr:MAG: hypothetical protein HUN04_25710 [Desulfobacter sp.]